MPAKRCASGDAAEDYKGDTPQVERLWSDCAVRLCGQIVRMPSALPDGLARELAREADEKQRATNFRNSSRAAVKCALQLFSRALLFSHHCNAYRLR